MDSDWKPGSRKNKMRKGSDDLDDILGDLLSDEPAPKKKPQSQPASKSKASTQNLDEDFYSNLAAMADNEESEVSEADVSQMARSIADLEDMDADLFGGQRSNSMKARAGRQSTPRRTPTPRSAKSPSGARSGSPTPKADSPTNNAPAISPRSESIKRRPPSENKPGTAPGKMTGTKSSLEDIYASNPARPRYSTGQDLERPVTVPKAKPKYTFGDFDEDDPLKGLLSDDEDDFGTKKKEIPKKEMKSAGDELGESQTENMMRNRDAQPESPRRRNLFDRPPTRSGTNSGGQDSNPSVETVVAAPVKPASAPRRQETVFSDDDDSLLGGLGIDEKPSKPKQQETSITPDDNKPAKSIMDSLLGKDSVSKQLEPKERKEFILDKKFTKPEEDTDGFVFGGYQPSAASDTNSRPTSRRSVRFQDDDDIFGIDKPISRGGSRPPSRPTKSNDLDWLEMASSSKKTPSRETTPNTEKKPASSNADWLGIKENDEDISKPTQKPGSPAAASIETTKKPIPQTKVTVDSDKKGSADWLGLKSGDTVKEDYLGLGTEVDPDTLVSNPPASPRFGDRRKSVDDRRKSVDDLFDAPARRDSQSSIWSSGSRQKQSQSPRNKTSSSPRNEKATDSEPLLAVGSPRVSLQSQLKQLQKLDELETSTPPDNTKKILQRPPSPNLSKPSTPLTLTSDTLYSISDEQRDFLFKDTNERPRTPQSVPTSKPVVSTKSSIQPSPSINMPNTAQQVQILQQQEELQRKMESLQKQYQSALTPQIISQSEPFVMKSHGFGQTSMSTSSANIGVDAQHALIQKLQIDLEYSKTMNETLKKRCEEETFAIENSYKSRIQLLEETQKRREERWKEENELLSSQHMNRIRQLEQEKLDMSANNHRKCEEIDRERSQDIERLTQIHRNAINNIKKEHEEDIARIKRIKDQEIDAVANAHDTSKSLNAVVEQIHSNAKDLGGLQEKVDTWHKMGLDEREIHIRSKDEQLKLLQVRLEKQQADNDMERQRLEDLIARLEMQLREQTRLIDEERWKLKQEQSKLQSMQGSQEEERKVWTEQQLRERAAIDRSKEQLLEEQRSVLNKLYEEKKILAQERAEFDVKVKVHRDEDHQMAIKLTQARAEYEALTKVITDEKSFSEMRLNELQKEEQRSQEERRKIEMEKAELEKEKRELSSLALQVKHRSEDIDQMCNAAAISRDEGEKALAEAKMIQSEQHQRSAQINSQMQALRLKEKQLSEDRVHTAKEKKDVDNMKNSMLCYNCRLPLKSTGENADMNVTAPPVMNGATNQNSVYYTNVYQTNLNAIESINAKINADKNVRLWKLQALKDKEFLEEESLFLEALKHSPYNAGNS